MKHYLLNIITRISQFSEKIDNVSLFIDKPWVLIDTETNYHKYIFKSNGELIMSLNGSVQVGKWEYIKGTRSILVDRIKDKLLLNQSFLDNAVLVLKIDGFNNDLFVLANETIIPDLNVKKYLQSITYQRLNIITGQLENGRVLEIHREYEDAPLRLGMKATIDGEYPENGKYKSQNSGNNYEIKNGRIYRITYPFQYQCSEGRKLTIEQIIKGTICKGDLVYVDNQLAKTGKYKIGIFTTLSIVNGVVKKKSLF
jgi:hypothetical protein